MDYRSLFSLPSYEDILSQYPDADPSTVSAKVTASGGEASSASLKLSVSAEDGAITSSAIASSVVEADGKQVETTASADPSGATSTSLDLATSVDQQGSEAVFSATADAQAGEGGTASTNVVTTGFDLEDIVKHETISEEPSTSSTKFEAVTVEDVEVEPLELTLTHEQMEVGVSDVDWSF